jgi:hypothetical protein
MRAEDWLGVGRVANVVEVDNGLRLLGLDLVEEESC